MSKASTLIANMNIIEAGLFAVVESLPPTLVVFRNSSGQISGGQLSWSGAPVVTHNTVEIQVKEDIQSSWVLSDTIEKYINEDEDKVGVGIFSIESYHK